VASAVRWVRTLALPAITLAVWEAISRAGWVSPIILPAPSQVFLRWIAYARPLEPYDPAQGGWLAWAGS
jgi:NitT/TauT family transport system permease protein